MVAVKLILVLSFVVAGVSFGCGPAEAPAIPLTETTTTLTSTPVTSATPSESARAVAASIVVDGELKPSTEIVFEVRPLSGPGTMGPTVLSATSDAALEEVRAYLAAHPEGGPLRVECGINPTRMSSSPDAKWPAGLALQIARWLVDHGVDCKRLEVVGWLDKELGAKERVRFFVDTQGRGRPAEEEARRDACAR